ncbi:MAG: hypothetical protein AB1609_19210 [Bacillota bacterium]
MRLRKPASVTVQVNLPFVGIKGTWEPDQSEQWAAWELYVELVTRVSLAELSPDEGLLREALSSLHTLFNTTRQILRRYGPSVAQPKGKGNTSFGHLAVALLNVVLRPVLAKWHPILLQYEATKPPSVSPPEHERQWDRGHELREVLASTRAALLEYASLLAEVAKVPSLIMPLDGSPKGG